MRACNLRKMLVIGAYLIGSANCVAASDAAQAPADQASSMTAEAKGAEIARLKQEIERQQAAYEKRPRRKFISANTRETQYQAYMASWVARIEQVGNSNFPEVARRNKSDANVVLSVAVKRDGSVERVDIVQTSGRRELDDAAMELVLLSAPFDPLPETKADIDVLHITRVWHFMAGHSVNAQVPGP